jgi:uncharacterized membrane protein
MAGGLHLLWPSPFLSITPGWVPAPQTVVTLTGVCELLGAMGLWMPRLHRAAAVGLALYAICVFPANIKHARDSSGGAQTTDLALFYHLPRLALQPVLVWLPLFAAGIVTWPLRSPRPKDG